MNAVKAMIDKLGARFDAYSQRERALMAVALVGGVLLVGNALWVDPNLARARTATKLAEQQRLEAAGLETQVAELQAQMKVDPDAGTKVEIARLMAELTTIESSLKALEGSLVPPEQMTAVLEQLLANYSRLRLVSLKSLPPVNLAQSVKPEEAAKSSKEELGLYKHGVEVRLEGSYNDLYAWLAQLETTQHKLLWGDARFAVAEYPRSILTLTLYTLSTDKAWLAI